MNHQTRRTLTLAAICLLVTTASCRLAGQLLGNEAQPQSSVTQAAITAAPATESSPPESAPAASPTEESAPPATEPAAGEPTPTSAPQEEASIVEQSCAEETCVLDGSFALHRPIGPQGRRTIVYSSRFGTIRQASGDARQGVFFLNSTGTPVLAAADGVVVVAGDDANQVYGRQRGFYGNLVILQHDLPGLSAPLFTLYGHLAEVSVQNGDEVTAGQEIGLVGSSGAATGSTLIFEVRYGENNAQAVRNPELWLEPLTGEDGQLQGALAGRIVDAQGKYLGIDNIVLEQLSGPGQPAIEQYYVSTYSGSSLSGLEPWEENFAIGDLPAGSYQISFWLGGMQQRVIEVEPGRLTLVTFRIE